MRIAFAGTPEFAVPALAALAQSPHTVVGVLTQPDRPAGRGLKVAASPVKQLAQRLQLPVGQPARLRSADEQAILAAWQPELLVVVAYGLILPPAVLALPRFGCVNIHASLLPRWRGAAPIQRAILAGDARSGVSLMQMDAGLDTGAVLAQAQIPISTDTTGGRLHDALAELGAAMLPAILDDLAAGRARPVPQLADGVTYAAKIHKEEARIDWRQPAAAIARQVMAFNPWPVAWTELADEPLRLWTAWALPESGAAVAGTAPARVAATGTAATGRAAAGAVNGTAAPCGTARGDAANAAPGTVLGLVDGRLHIRCGEGVLAVGSLQRAGRRVLEAVEFVRGAALTGVVCA